MLFFNAKQIGTTQIHEFGEIERMNHETSERTI